MSETNEESTLSTLRLSQEAVISFSRQLTALLKAGITLYKAIQIIESQSGNNNTLRTILREINKSLAEGLSFGKSLALFPACFSPFYINLIKVGESNGKLDEALQQIVTYLEISRENNQKLINSLTYPAILIISSIAVLIFMIIVVLPKFMTIFTQAEIRLPLPTRIILAIGNVFQKYSVFILLGLILLVILYIFLRKQKNFRYALDKFYFQIPLFGEILSTSQLAGFSRTFGTLYNSGIQLLDSLELSKNIMSNSVLGQELEKVSESVRNGKSISEPLSKAKIFPPLLSQMYAVGEETGNLGQMALDLAKFYEQETDYKLKKILALIEPLALVFIAGLVAFIASSIMLPLFRMAGSMRSF